MNGATSPTSIRLIGDVSLPEDASLLDFWQWAFGDIFAGEGITRYFAEWMVRILIGLPLMRRVSWADSDIITRAEDGLR